MASAGGRAILFVDGYNIIGTCPRLAKQRDRHGFDAARHRLSEDLAGYSAFKGYQTKLVFDAYRQGTPSREESVTDTLHICYTHPHQTADSYIEQACAQFRHDFRKFSHRLIVATSDRAQQLTVVGYGAEWMSAQRLLLDIRQVKEQVRRKKRSSLGHSKRFLASRLKPDVQQQLEQLRRL
ncbi:MAG: NYN domain-containing protein [Leptolyngbyaceae bacterium]|nr:NYN domain-containing protein [Leptolyngbyaceae bacterium]